MTRHLIFICLAISLFLNVNSQDSVSRKIFGKWGICISVDTFDLKCENPFNYYIFKPDGSCQHGEVTIMNEKIPVLGRWKLENTSLQIKYDKHQNFSFPNEIFREIVFVNDKMFYYKVLDNYEVAGHWVFFSFRKIE